MADGSSFAQVSTAIVTALLARTGLNGVTVSEDPPRTPADIMSSTTGLYDAVHVGTDIDITFEPPFLGTPVTLQEEYDLPIVVQVLRFGTDAASQATVNARCAALLGEVVGCLCLDPVVGMTATSTLIEFEFLPVSAHKNGSWVGSSGDGHGCSVELMVRCNARLKVT